MPTQSNDELCADLLCWFGLAEAFATTWARHQRGLLSCLISKDSRCLAPAGPFAGRWPISPVSIVAALTADCSICFSHLWVGYSIWIAKAPTTAEAIAATGAIE